MSRAYVPGVYPYGTPLEYVKHAWSLWLRLDGDLHQIRAFNLPRRKRGPARYKARTLLALRQGWLAWERSNPAAANQCMAETPEVFRKVYPFLRRPYGSLDNL